jgi:serine protease
VRTGPSADGRSPRATAVLMSLSLVAAGLVATAVPATASVRAASVGSADAPRQLPRPRGHATPSAHAADHVLVRFRSGTTIARQSAGVRSAGGTALRAVNSTGYARVVTTDVAGSLRALKADPAVAWAGYDYVRHATAVPNDPGYSPSFQKPYLDLVRLPQAWSVTTGSLSQVVAVVDSGVDGTAPDLAGRVLPGQHFFDAGLQDGNAAPAPVDGTCPDPAATGHGTFVSSVAAADTNNGYGLAGAAWNAKILPVRVLDQCGDGFDSDVGAGIVWAADHGATVVNLSLGGPDPSPPLQAALQYAVGKGIPVVVAAGNDGSAVPQYPAAYPEAISVGATDATGQLTSFSSFGDWVDLAAPGWDILGEEPRGVCADPSDPHPADCYFIGAGTSFAAPLVSGVTALLRTKFPSWTPAQIRNRLEWTARDAGPTGFDPFYGYGVLDAYAALGGPRVVPRTDPVIAAVPPDFPAGARSQSSNTWKVGFDYTGRPVWYRFSPGSDASATISVVPDPIGVDRTTLPAQLKLVVSAYDSQLRLLGSSSAAADGSPVTLNVTLPDEADYIAVSNGNGSVPGSTQLATATVTLHGPGTVGAPGPAAWVDTAWPQDLVDNPQPPLTAQPTVTFVRDMDPGTLTSQSVQLRDGTTGAVVPTTLSYDTPTRVLTLAPTASLLEGTPYVVSVNAGSPGAPATDAGGNVMPEFLNWFTTYPEQPPPPVTNPHAIGSPWGATLAWDHPQNGDFGYVVVRYSTGTTPPSATTGTLGYSGSLDSATIVGLVAGQDYAFSVFTYGTYGFNTPDVSTAGTVVLAGTRTTLTSTLGSPQYGQTTTVTATVRSLAGSPAAGRTVLVYWRRTGTTAWTLIGSPTTNPSGQVSFPSTPPWNATYYAVDVGGAGTMGSTAMLALPVRFLVTSTTIPATATVGQTIRIGGTVAPGRPGGRVWLEGLWSNTWHLLGYATLTSHSTYSLTVVPTKRSTYVYRVYEPADTLLTAGVTASYRMVVS